MSPLTRTNKTVLLVCEGYAEIELARVIRDLYLPRGCGVSLRAENRRGYGGAAALELAIQRQRVGDYDHYAVLVDTDAHWSNVERQLAVANGITAIECTPCLEAILLKLDHQRFHERTSDNKAEFERVYGGSAHRPGVIQRNFPRSKFDDARQRIPTIDRLLALLGH
jgi:hypothetical protein